MPSFYVTSYVDRSIVCDLLYKQGLNMMLLCLIKGKRVRIFFYRTVRVNCFPPCYSEYMRTCTDVTEITKNKREAEPLSRGGKQKDDSKKEWTSINMFPTRVDV
jgi:hypothetical protein